MKNKIAQLKLQAKQSLDELTDQQKLGGAATLDEVLDLAQVLYKLVELFEEAVNTPVAQLVRAPGPEIREVAGSSPARGAIFNLLNAIEELKPFINVPPTHVPWNNVLHHAKLLKERIPTGGAALSKAKAIVGYISLMDANGTYFNNETLRKLDSLCQTMREEYEHPPQEAGS